MTHNGTPAATPSQDAELTLNDTLVRLQQFNEARNWEQFHNPKNLVMALAAEVGELITLFQWLTPAESDTVTTDPERVAAVADELADIGIYLLLLTNSLDLDLLEVIAAKISRNESRFPPGSASAPPTNAPE